MYECIIHHFLLEVSMQQKSKYAGHETLLCSTDRTAKEIATILGVSLNAVYMARKKIKNPHRIRQINRKSRVKNGEKINKYNRTYRAKSQQSAENLGEEWTNDQDFLVLNSPLKGLDLAKELGRTLDAIYIRRHRLKSDNV